MGVASALGVETGTLVWIAAAAAALAAVLASSEIAFNVVKWAGVGYLAYLGIRTLRRPGLLPLENAQPVGASLVRAFLQGLVINVLNPKVALFFVLIQAMWSTVRSRATRLGRWREGKAAGWGTAESSA